MKAVITPGCSSTCKAASRKASFLPTNTARSRMKAKFEAMLDDKGQPLNSLVFKPKELYQSARECVAPDLIVHFGGLVTGAPSGLVWIAISMSRKTTPDRMLDHAQFGMFLLAAANNPLSGEYQGARLLDIAPTLLDLAGYEIPESMQGRSLVAGMEKRSPGDGTDAESQQIIHDRLAGLGYV